MKKKLLPALLPLLLLVLTGCGSIGEKSSSLRLLYAATAILSLLTLTGYLFLEKKRKSWFLLLFASVCIVNSSYFLLSCAGTVNAALWANRLAYLGSVTLPLSMLMIITDVIGLRRRTWLVPSLLGLSLVVFLLTASYPLLTWYYRDAWLETQHGATQLVKEYGPAHTLYLFYLLGYFIAMIVLCLYATVKKKLKSPVQAFILCVAVFLNIGVWLVEQLIKLDFEILSISYIITELFLLGLHLIIQEQLALPPQAVPAASAQAALPEVFAAGLHRLTQTERTICRLYLEGKNTKDVLQALNITENTLKFHNKNIYGKLGVSSRKQLLEIARAADVQLGS